jgi:hypothetical protein
MSDDIVVNMNFNLGKDQTVADIVTRLHRHDHDWLPDVHTPCDYCDALYEIERLQRLADDLAHHLRGYVCHCNMSKCKCGYDDVMDEYEAVRGE